MDDLQPKKLSRAISKELRELNHNASPEVLLEALHRAEIIIAEAKAAIQKALSEKSRHERSEPSDFTSRIPKVNRKAPEKPHVQQREDRGR